MFSGFHFNLCFQFRCCCLLIIKDMWRPVKCTASQYFVCKLFYLHVIFYLLGLLSTLIIIYLCTLTDRRLSSSRLKNWGQFVSRRLVLPRRRLHSVSTSRHIREGFCRLDTQWLVHGFTETQTDQWPITEQQTDRRVWTFISLRDGKVDLDCWFLMWDFKCFCGFKPTRRNVPLKPVSCVIFRTLTTHQRRNRLTADGPPAQEPSESRREQPLPVISLFSFFKLQGPWKPRWVVSQQSQQL